MTATVTLTFKVPDDPPTPTLVASFVVEGEPVSKARARFTGYGSKIRSYTPQKTMDAERGMALAFIAAGGSFEPDREVTFAVEAVFHNATRQRRDVDNMLKLVLDGLNNVAWVDDTQVMRVVGSKEFVDAKTDARTEVLVYKVGHMNRITRDCARCGNAFITYRSTASQRFCSRECHLESRLEARARTCEHCGKDWDPGKPGSKARFCSAACRHDGTRAVIPCDICGKKFKVHRSWVHDINYCSSACVIKGSIGDRDSRKTTHFPGMCGICGAGTTRKEYKRCNPCKLAGKPIRLEIEEVE